MSLFICPKCKSVENLHCVRDKTSQSIRDYHGPMEEFFPNIHSMSMTGNGFAVMDDIYVNGKIWKAANEIMMLCSACNTGKWHDEFSRELATEEELEIASHSKCSMITPYDHDISLVKDDNTPHGYRLATPAELKKKNNMKAFVAATTAMFPQISGILHKGDIKDNVIELSETDKNKLRAAELKRERKALKKGK